MQIVLANFAANVSVKVSVTVYNMDNNNCYKVALGGVISSLCIMSMFLTGVIPFLSLTLPMICGLLITIIVVEVNPSWAFMTYIAVSLL